MSAPLTLRPYQKEAVAAAVAHFRKQKQSAGHAPARAAAHDPTHGAAHGAAPSAAACLVLPTGAGKSLVIAELCRIAQGEVLVLAHVKELCQQNYDKFCRTAPEQARQAGLYSAGLNTRDTDRKITFGSVQSVARHLDKLSQRFSLLIIDECHRMSGSEGAQYSAVLSTLRERNPNLFVLGLTATPYRLGMGWCYRRRGASPLGPALVRSDDTERPFDWCVYEVTLRHMVTAGYLTPPRILDAPIASYDFSALEGAGDDPDRVNPLLVRHKRVTRSISEQIVELTESEGRRGVMIFASTVEHAEEIMSYLPQAQAGLIVGSTPSSERDRIISDFCAQQLRYLVNVAVLTTGFDAPHVDFIALLRKTESVSLFQQIAGRGLRLFPGKRDCLIVDYAGNGYDIFAPEIGETKPNAASEMVQVKCPVCAFDNDFWGLLDGDGHVVEHYGRRCHGMTDEGARCDYRFRFKECPKCNAECDIAARGCPDCGHALVDPDQMLKDALRLKDALVLRVSGVDLQISGEVVSLVYHDEDGATVKDRFDMSHKGQRAVFNRTFARRIASGRRPLELESSAHVEALWHLLPRPDFVVARAQKIKGKAGLNRAAKFFRVETRVFDYEGRFRTAASAD